MIREVAYDEVFDSQKHFRSLLDSVSRPGKINRLDTVRLDPPPGLNTASVMIAMALLDADSTFDVIGMSDQAASYIRENTGARRTRVEHAHFLFADGTETPDFLDSAHCGTLLYPDTAATVVLQAAGLSSADAIAGGLRLTLLGPGIEGTTSLFVKGVNVDLLLALQARNAEFPLGLDTLLTFGDTEGTPYVAALPRTAHVTWEAC